MYIAGFGQGAPPSARVPFKRPRQASPALAPHLLQARFVSHIHPFPSILPSAVALPGHIPGPSRRMQPSRPVTASRPKVAAIPAAAPSVPGAAGMKGFGAAGLGAGPYTMMRAGFWSPYAQTPSRIRSGAAQAPQLVQAARSPYVRQFLPAGGFKANRAY